MRRKRRTGLAGIDRVGLREAANRKAAGYSKGMRQRIRRRNRLRITRAF